MARFLYFLEGHAGAAILPWQLDQYGLRYAFESTPQCGSGAVLNGVSGALVGARDDTPFRIDLQAQRWVQISPPCQGRTKGRVWLGWWLDKNMQPGPDALQREALSLECYDVRLADGNQWQIPILRKRPYTGVDEINLPMVVMLGADGKPELQIKSEYQGLFLMAEELREHLFNDDSRKLDIAKISELAELALSVQYRVSRAEICALGLIDTQNIKDIVDALLDGPNLRQFLEEHRGKKNDAFTLGAT